LDIAVSLAPVPAQVVAGTGALHHPRIRKEEMAKTVEMEWWHIALLIGGTVVVTLWPVQSVQALVAIATELEKMQIRKILEEAQKGLDATPGRSQSDDETS
jgi:xanthine/CO dehydrogenase XdhC/CoxF family maturation factor